MKLYTCTSSYHKIHKCNTRNSFRHLMSLAFFCWCLQYKCPTSKQLPYLGSIYCSILFFIWEISRWNLSPWLSETATIFPGKYSRQDCRKWCFNMLHPKAQHEESSSSTISVYFAAYFFKRVPGSLLSNIQFIFAVRVLKNMLYLRTDENATDVVALYQITIHRKLLCDV